MTTASDAVCAGRSCAELSQSELARRSGVPQPSISRIEAGRRNPSIELLDRLLAPAGQHLSVIPTRTSTVAESASIIRGLIDEGSSSYVFRALIQVANDLADADPALRVALTVTPPTLTGHRGVDAFLAAIVDYRITGQGLPPPSWINEPQRTTPDEWVASGLLALADLTREGTPEPFLRRGVLIHESDLVSY